MEKYSMLYATIYFCPKSLYVLLAPHHNKSKGFEAIRINI